MWVIYQIAFVASLKEIGSQFYLLQFVAKGKCACFLSPLGFAIETWS